MVFSVKNYDCLLTLTYRLHIELKPQGGCLMYSLYWFTERNLTGTHCSGFTNITNASREGGGGVDYNIGCVPPLLNLPDFVIIIGESGGLR